MTNAYSAGEKNYSRVKVIELMRQTVVDQRNMSMEGHIVRFRKIQCELFAVGWGKTRLSHRKNSRTLRP
uniref:Uncharacterized protein n=1 Tax=Anguilla anguilla TaxID=7936 RepID=A0A0E9W3C4_ANGAN